MSVVCAGIVHQLKERGEPVRDGADHLIPFCETLEAILRQGLKSESLPYMHPPVS